MSKDIIKKPATEVSKWFAKETLGNFIYDQISLLWRSAIMTAVVTGCLRLFSGIPLDVWLIVALFIAALIVFILDRVARRRGWLTLHSAGTSSPALETERDVLEAVAPTKPATCPYELVHRIADHEAKVIRDFVSVSRVAVWEHKLNDPVPTIKWGFMIKNDSIFPISLTDVGNNLFFEDTELAERRFEDHNEVQQLPPWREGGVVFEQRLSGPEAQYIRNTPDGNFRFNRLKIKVGNPNNFPTIEPQELEIGNELETTLNGRAYKETKGTESLKKRVNQLKGELGRAKGADANLTFEIDEKQTQVHATGGGTAGRRISVKVRLRCIKVIDHPMAIREFHAALLKENGTEQVIVPQEGSLVVLGYPDMKVVDFSNGWTISEPLTEYRWFMFFLDVSEQQLGMLSHEHFIRITMVAVGQKPYSIDFYVDNWEHARGSNSYITIKNHEGR